MSEVSNDDSVKERSHTSENKLHLDPEESQSSLKNLEKFSVKNVMESDRGTMEISANELIPAEVDILKNEMDLSLSENIHSVESESGSKSLENVDLYNDDSNKLNNSQKLTIDKANDSDIADVSLKGISTKDHDKADKKQRNVDNTESETHGSQSTDANIYCDNFCIVNGSQEICEIYDSIRSCVDAILDNVCLTEKENELVNIDFVVKNKEKLEALSQELSLLNRSPVKSQVKKENNCDIFQANHVLSSEEKPQNFIKPLNTEINKSGKQNMDACCNSEKDNFQSMIVDIVMKAISIDNGKSGERGILEPETQEHENSEANVKGENRFVSDYKEVVEINDDVVSCVDTVLENLSLTKEKTELNDEFVVGNRETPEEINHKLRKLDKSLQKDQMKGDNCDTFGLNYVISSEEKQENFIEPLNTEINNSGKQNIHECCNLEKDNSHSMNIDIVLKDISEHNGGADKKGVTELQTQEHANRENNISSGDSCFIKIYKEVTEINDDVKSCVDTILENLSLTKKNVELINDNFVVSKSEKSQEISQELSKLGRNLKEDQVKGDNYDAIGVNHAISSEEKQENFIEPLNTEINNSVKQNTYECCNLEKDNFHAMNVDIVRKDISEDKREADRRSITEPESQEHENGENNINSGDNCFINPYKEVIEINEDVKSCVDMILENLSLTEEKVELINDNFAVSNGEKSEEISQQLGKLVISPQENQMKTNNCDTYEVTHTISSQENFIKPLNTEINNSGKEDIYACCYSENGNFPSMDGDVVMTDVSEDNGTEGKRDTAADITKPETQEHEKGVANVNSVDSCFINKYIAEINSDVRSCADKILQNLNLTEKDTEINDDFTVTSKELMEEDRQELSKLSRIFQKTEMKGDNSCDIKSDVKCKLLDTEINSYSIDVNLKDISTKDFEKGNHTESGIDESEIEAHEQHNTEDNIYSGKSNVIISNGGVGEKSDVIKLNHPLLEIPSLTENRSERNNIDLVVSSSETSEKNSQELNKLGRSLQDDQVKVHSCDLFGVNHVINSDLSFSKPLDAESSDSHVQSIDSYSYSKKDFDSDSFKYIRSDCGKADHINRGTDNVENEAHKQVIEVSICSGKSSVINSNRRVSGKSDDFKLSDPLLGIATLTENGSKSINVDLNANDNEKSEKITQESKLGKNLPKDQMNENNCDSNSDINFSKRLDTEITDSHAQGIDVYSNSEKDKCNLDSIDVSFGHLSTKDCRKAGHISRAIDNAETETFEQQNIEDRICCSKSSVIKSYERVGGTSDDTKSSLPQIEIASLTENENELIHVGFIANSEKTEAVCQELNMVCGSTQKDETKIDNNCITLGLKHASSPEEKHKDLDNALDTDTNNLCKQNTDAFNNREKENSDSVIDVNLKTTSLKDQGRPSESDNNNSNAACETLKHQKTKASTCSSIVDRVSEINPLESKSTNDPEDSEVIIIFDNGEEHLDYEIFDENSNDFIGKKNNIDVQSQEKFKEELDNKLEIFKAQYSDIESTLVTASESFSLETLYKFIAKIKKECNACVQSLEKLRIRSRNKWLRTKSETSNEKTTPSCSYKQPDEPFKTPFDKYRYRSQACTKLHTTISNNNRLYRKIESHHFVEYNSAMFPRETVQTSHRCRQSPEHFSSSENEICNNLHKKKCKSSHYSYERKSQRFNEDKGLDKCCLSKNSPYSTETIGGRPASDTKKYGYSSKMGSYAKVGGFSKSSFVHKGLKSPRNYIPYSSHSNPAPRLSSPNENYSILKPHCYRKKVSEGRKQKDFKSPKYGREYDFNSDSSDSLQLSSDSDRESTGIHSDHYYDHDKYYNRTPKWIKKEKVSSGSRKRKYKRNGYSTSNSDSSVQEVEAPFEKRHHKQVAYEWDTENKRVQGLIDRQMDFINKHVSGKDDLVKFQESAFIPSNVAEKDKRQKYSNRKFSDDEISSANDMPSIYENQKKRKKNASEPMATPYKLSKISNRTDVHSFLKNQYNSPNSDAKLRSSVVAPSPHSPVLSEESDRRTSYKQAKARNRVYEDIFENTSKYNIKSCKAQLQSSVVSPSRNLISPVKTKRRRNDKENDSLSLKTLRDPVPEYSEIKMSNLDNRRRGKIWNDAVQGCRNVDDQEWSENEINNVKDMQSYVSFLKKKKGSYTNMELLLKDPMDDIWPKSVTNDEFYVDTHRENKHKSGRNEELGPKTKLMQKSPETDSMYPENSSGKVKKTVRVPKIYSEMTEQSLNERSDKGKPMLLTQMSNSKKKPVRLPRMSSEVVEQSEIERPTKKKHVRISPFSSEMTEQNFIENPSLKKSPRVSRISSKVTEQNFIEKPKQKKSPRQCSSPVSSEITEQNFIEKPAKKKPLRISPISWEVTEKSLIQKPTMKKSVCIPQISSKVTKKGFIEEPAMKKPVCIPQITSKVTEKRSTQKPAKKKPVEDEKDLPVFNRSLDLFKQLNREIGKKKVTKHTPVSSKASAHDVHSKYQD